MPVIATTGQDVLAFLSKNHLEPTPVNYHLGYLYLTGGSKIVVTEVEEFVQTKMRIRQADAIAIMARHTSQVGTIAEAMNPTSPPQHGAPQNDDAQRNKAMETFMRAAVDLTRETQRTAGEFQRDIAQDNAIIQAGAQGEELGETILRIIERSQRAEKELSDASNRIDRLQIDLAEARNRAMNDELTGLPNRRSAKQLMERLDAEQASYTIAIVDIDHFKRVNDTFGHPVGDRLIKFVGDTLKDDLEPDMVARWGGEEYLIISQNNSLKNLTRRLDRARMDVSSRRLKVREDNVNLGKITISGGVAKCEGNSQEAVEIADALLYEAKQNGRDQIRSSSKLKAA